MEITSDELIFLVDDDPSILAILEHYFRRKAFGRIMKFPDGESCVAHLSLQPRLVVLDHHLSLREDSLNGFDVFKLIKDLHPLTKVVMMSAQEDNRLVLQMIKQGVVHYVVKDTAMMQALEEVMEEL
ncbi:MAG: response regulator [Ferruginibacter sp.]|nr:response regulator [Cytophagales bacterium]